jgi:voltage-dependent potassium channel beta subunit
MKYRQVGNTGLKISEISYGSWLTTGGTLDDEIAKKCLSTALESGINFIDSADVYTRGEAERVIGDFLKEETYRRRDLVISSKVFWPMSDDINDRGLSRKHTMESIDSSLERLNIDDLDIYYAHRFDKNTALEETIGAMDDIVKAGKVHYWGTSVWTAANLERAFGVAKEMKANAPKVEQPRYNMLDRTIELDIMEVAKRNGMGITVWSPLYYGILTGKYNDGIPEGSRGSEGSFQNILDKVDLDKVRKITEMAKELDITTAQLALAWILRRDEISAAIIGGTKPEQIFENVQASDVTLTKDNLENLEELLDNKPLFPGAYNY